MLLLKKWRAESSGLGPASYAPIANAFNTLPEDERERLKVKFDVTYFVAMEKLSFTKYPKICELEAHGVHVGTSYCMHNACKVFVHYIAEARQKDLRLDLTKAKFFSLLLDGSTDKVNIDMFGAILMAVMRRFTRGWNSLQRFVHSP